MRACCLCAVSARPTTEPAQGWAPDAKWVSSVCVCVCVVLRFRACLAPSLPGPIPGCTPSCGHILHQHGDLLLFLCQAPQSTAEARYCIHAVTVLCVETHPPPSSCWRPVLALVCMVWLTYTCLSSWQWPPLSTLCGALWLTGALLYAAPAAYYADSFCCA